ncbi:syntaxin-like protein [Mycena olivaceomarginata]|nr:syntaxin-like protein [Mycena olivaceomarginata]
MSLAKLTSISTQTLPSPPTPPTPPPSQPPSLHLAQITQNLNSLRSGILALEAREGRSDAVGLLRKQHERMRAMLGAGEEEGVERSVARLTNERPKAQLIPSPPAELVYTPYTDDPEAAPGELLQTQRLLMDPNSTCCRTRSTGNGDISLQINDELEVHTGLLEELDTDLGQTDTMLGSARRRLDRVAKGAKNNGSTVTIGALILILLVLIIIFKT